MPNQPFGESFEESFVDLSCKELIDLLRRCDAEHFAAKKAAVMYIGKYGCVDAVDWLLRELNMLDGEKVSPSALELQKEIIKALGSIGDHRVTQSLIGALQNPPLCEVAIVALGEIKHPIAIKALINQLNFKYAYAAARSLGKIKAAEAVDSLIKALRCNNSILRLAAKDALDEIGTPAAMPLIRELEKLNKKTCTNYIFYPDDIFDILSKLCDKNSVPSLVEIAENDKTHWRSRIYAIKLLGIIKDQKATKKLLTILKNKNNSEEIRLEAADSLGLIGDNQAVSQLIASLREYENEDIREHAARALGKIGDRKAIGALIVLLMDEELDIQKEARKALDNIHQKWYAFPEAEKAVSLLMRGLHREKNPTDYIAYEALQLIEPALHKRATVYLVRKLIHVLYTEDPQTVRFVIALKALGEIRNSKTCRVFYFWLTHDNSDDEVIKCAAQALANLVACGDNRARDVLNKAKNHSREEVRYCANQALKTIVKPVI